MPLRLGSASMFGALFLVSATSLFAADDLEKELLKQIPQVLDTLNDRGYDNVGVLKFRVKKGNEPISDRVGTLNLRLADKVKMALIVRNDIRDPIGVIKDANKVAAEIPGASHLSESGRKKFFNVKYPLAWGTEKVTPDALLTGVAVITPDLSSMTVGIMCFDPQQNTMDLLARFTVRPDLEDLLDSGESFTVRGVFDDGSLSLTSDERKEKATTEAVKTSLIAKLETAASKKSTSSKKHPLSQDNSDAPIRLEVRYDDVPQPIEFRRGAAFIPEPREGQKVSLIIKRNGSSRPRLGLVLKVNGENTLGRQTLPDVQCRAWVLEPDRDIWGIRGYYNSDDNSVQPFRVLSDAESKEKEFDYGEFVGTISASVYPERKSSSTPSADLLTDEAEDLAILAMGSLPDKDADDLAALRGQLSSITTRGLISNGESVDQDVGTTKFRKDPIPIMSATVKYYSPQDLPQ